ncbi:putative transcriptional regulator, MerR family [Desulfofarcimen acetoxidans DSM 771]|uniref:Putative transcriptional regulator, MerR family n=1 Tax=Desulfofarcimen acetoxidans (strain ATCC 49208 / DSM 771 / KCTC 5769 / VKM B-1644 / 5575) TaxID=485916 RepID=C8W0E2_DESAS|nr:MerR family transcriptional regulator [Desulfofarcimen acetoxidans]ACV63197.1 putative transcriptional regulator, MerR family [Desulfofarcimen acetoxidans DSM 771]
MEEKWLTLTQVAEEAGLSEITVKRYANLYDRYLQYRIFGRYKRYTPETVNLMIHISSLDQNGLTINEISEKLKNDYSAFMAVGNAKSYRVLVPLMILVNLLELLVKAMRQITVAFEYISAQEEELNKLREELKQMRRRLEKAEAFQKNTDKELSNKSSQSWWKRVFSK